MSEEKKDDEVLPQEPKSVEEGAGGSRRRLLKGLATGGAVIAGQEVLPQSWSKPLVDAVVLPAHAGFSPQPGDMQESDDDETGEHRFR